MSGKVAPGFTVGQPFNPNDLSSENDIFIEDEICRRPDLRPLDKICQGFFTTFPSAAVADCADVLGITQSRVKRSMAKLVGKDLLEGREKVGVNSRDSNIAR